MGSNLSDRVAKAAGRTLTEEEKAVIEDAAAARTAAERYAFQPPTAQELAGRPMGIVAALNAVMRDVTGVGKNDFHDSPSAKFKFRGIDAVINAVGPALRAHGVICMPQLVEITQRDVLTSKEKKARETVVRVRYVFTGPDGTSLTCEVAGEAMDNGDKGTAKAMSVAYRVALIQALCLPTDEPDPDHAAYERAADPARPDYVEARAELASEAKRQGWPLVKIPAVFEQIHGTPIGDCTDAAVIIGFQEALVADADKMFALLDDQQAADTAPATT